MALLLDKRKQVGARHQLLAHGQLDGTHPLAVLLHGVGGISLHANGPIDNFGILCAIPHPAQQLAAALLHDGVRFVVHVERHAHFIICATIKHWTRFSLPYPSLQRRTACIETTTAY